MRNMLSLLLLLVCLPVSPLTVSANCTMTFEHASPDTTTGSCLGSTIVTQPLNQRPFYPAQKVRPEKNPAQKVTPKTDLLGKAASVDTQ